MASQKAGVLRSQEDDADYAFEVARGSNAAEFPEGVSRPGRAQYDRYGDLQADAQRVSGASGACWQNDRAGRGERMG